MKRKDFLKKGIFGIVGFVILPKESAKEPDIKVTDIKRNYKYIGNDKGYPEYIIQGYTVTFSIDGKDLIGVLKK